MATRWDAMHEGFPEWIHIGMECGELMGEKDGKAVYRFQDGYIESYSMKEVTDFMDARVECMKDAVLECVRQYGVEDTIGFICGLYQEALIEEYEESELYKIADPLDIHNDAAPFEYWDGCGADENPLYQMCDL